MKKDSIRITNNALLTAAACGIIAAPFGILPGGGVAHGDPPALRYGVIDLGAMCQTHPDPCPPNMHPRPTAFAINNWGQVLGRVFYCDEFASPGNLCNVAKQRPFIWLPSPAYADNDFFTGLNLLDELYESIGFATDEAFDSGGINDAGQFVLAVDTSEDPSYSVFYDLKIPFGTGNPRVIDGLMTMENIQALRINNQDPPFIVGSAVVSADYLRAFRKELGDPNTAEILGSSSQAGKYYMATAISDTANLTTLGHTGWGGGLCLNCPDTTPCDRALYWNLFVEQHFMVLGFPNYVPTTIPRAINAGSVTLALPEQVVGHGYEPDGEACLERALFWPAVDMSPVPLPRLPDPLFENNEMQAYDISDPDANGHLWVVGADVTIDRAVVWRGIYDNGSYTWDAFNLNDEALIDDPCVAEVLDGHTLNMAVAVNNAGWIVARSGDAYYNNRSFLLVPLGIEGNGLGCPGDINLDGVVDVSDLLALLGAWGECPGDMHCYPLNCPADINRDGVVDVSDLLILLGNWGSCPGYPTQTVLTLEAEMEEAGLTMQDWNDYMSVMTGTDEKAKENWSCWMKKYIMQCVVCPACPGSDPFR